MQALLFLATACLAASIFTPTAAVDNAEISRDGRHNENTEPLTESYPVPVLPPSYLKPSSPNKERGRLQLSTAHPNDVAHPSETTASGKNNPTDDARGHPNVVPSGVETREDVEAREGGEARELQNTTLEWPQRSAPHPPPKGRPTSSSSVALPPQGVTQHAYDYNDLEPEQVTADVTTDPHPCLRECVEGAPPMTCRFRFEVEWYHAMSKACYNCPHNVTDCDRPDCITADGFKRPLIVVNRQMPGPSVEDSTRERELAPRARHQRPYWPCARTSPRPGALRPPKCARIAAVTCADPTA